MKWWGYLILVSIPLLILGICILRFLNNVVHKQEDIDEAKSHVRISKAKYLQVLRKVGTTQRESNDAQGSGYYIANRNGGGRLIGGAIGPIDSNFEGAGNLVVSLANEYQSAQQRLNQLVNAYNIYVGTFPRIILAKIFRVKPEDYVDSGNLDASTKLSGFDDDDI